MTHADSNRTLLLTQGYEPIQIISWQRAITLLALHKVEVVEQYDQTIRAPSMVLNVPEKVTIVFVGIFGSWSSSHLNEFVFFASSAMYAEYACFPFNLPLS